MEGDCISERVACGVFWLKVGRHSADATGMRASRCEAQVIGKDQKRHGLACL